MAPALLLASRHINLFLNIYAVWAVRRFSNHCCYSSVGSVQRSVPYSMVVRCLPDSQQTVNGRSSGREERRGGPGVIK